MKKLSLRSLSSEAGEELSLEEKCLTDVVLRSGSTQLISLSFSGCDSWFEHIETSSNLFEFIQNQTCLQKLYFMSYVSSEACGQLYSALVQSESLETI